MAANHIAMVRSSARMANMRSHETMANQDDTMRSGDELGKSGDDLNSSMNNDSVGPSLAEELSQMSVISIGSGEVAAVKAPHQVLPRKASLVPGPMVAKLKHLDTVSNIDDCVDAELSQERTLDRLERNWKAISEQFQNVVDHLTLCSKEVLLSSEKCLGSLVESIDLTCDKVDGEMKALYQMISKCDELTTKLSIASSFREEIKTLRKSVETLEALYKNRPKSGQQDPARRRPTTTRAASTADSVSVRSEARN